MTKYEVITQEFINNILNEAKEVIKISPIKANELTKMQTVISKEGPELGMPEIF